MASPKTFLLKIVPGEKRGLKHKCQLQILIPVILP
jgi:hypothetical protein